MITQSDSVDLQRLINLYVNNAIKGLQKCCNSSSTGGIGSVYTQQSDSITWEGNGQQTTPLIANLRISGVPGNILTINPDGIFASGAFWSKLGDTGTLPATNFIGTLDSQAFVFRVNNQRAGIIGIATNFANPASVATGSGGVALGHYALHYLTENAPTGTLHLNTAIGAGAGRWIGYTGANEDQPGSTSSAENTLLGMWAGHYLQKRNLESNVGRNVAIGESAMYRSLAGSDNVAIGNFAMEAGYKPRGNTAVGRDSLRGIGDGYGNTAIGALSQAYCSTGVGSITVTNGGSGYTTANVVISSPVNWSTPGICFGTATAVAVINAGVITAINVVDPGCGYSSKGGTYPNAAVIPVGATVTITGDGTGAVATANIVSNESNTSLGSSSGLFRRFGTGNLYLGYSAGAGTRFFDDYTIMIGTGSDVDVSIAAGTKIEKSIAIGYNAKVAASNTFSIGGTGADAVNVVIGGITASAKLDIVGNLKIGTVTNDDTETNLLVYPADGIIQYRTLSSIINGTVSGTKNYIPKFISATTIGDSRIIEITNGTGNFVSIDDAQTGATTTNNFLFNVANNFEGDGSASQTPLSFYGTRAAAVVNINVIQMGAPNCSTGSAIKFSIGRSMVSKNMFIPTFNYVASGSNSNYYEENFHSVGNIRRAYASGNSTFGVAADNGFKVEIGGTTRINNKLTLGVLGGVTGVMDFVGTTSGIVTIQAADAAGTWAMTLPTSDGNSGEFLQTDGSGVTSWQPVSNIIEDTYTPTLFNVTNVASSIATTTRYVRIGNWVHVYGVVDIDATAAATFSELGMSLPVASDFASGIDLNGTGAFFDNTIVQIIADPTNDRATFKFTPQTDTNNKYSFHFSYKVL